MALQELEKQKVACNELKAEVTQKASQLQENATANDELKAEIARLKAIVAAGTPTEEAELPNERKT